jgi:hypothetical protein
MADTTANSLSDTARPSNDGMSGDVTVMDIWLVLRVYRRSVMGVIAAVTLAGAAIAFYLPAQYEFTTAIEIGNQVVNDEIIPIEASTTVVDKLQTGYVPLITSQFVQQNPDGPEEYVIEIKGSENSQIVQVLSQAPRDQRALITDLHGQVVQELVEDHNRTVDAMRANAEIALSEAEQKLGAMVAQERALTAHLSSISDTLFSLDAYTVELKDRITSAEAEINALQQRGGNNTDTATQILMLSNQIGAWRTVLINIENRDKVDIFVIRADAQVKLDNNAQEQKTAQNEIEYRETNLENIQATRALGQGTVMSLKPVAPNKPLIVAVALVIGILAGIATGLILDFLRRAGQIEQGGR